ncbi:MAG TPA: TatD family hydrolase, partial [Geobacterales bacterium]|nr:TatD family hydrolase [Geobacterales bacterium]
MKQPSLMDSHAHIDGHEFAADLDLLLARAKEAQVERIINVGADLESSHRSVALSGRHKNIFAAVGIHPHDAERVTPRCYEIIAELAQNSEKVVAIGEIGL